MFGSSHSLPDFQRQLQSALESSASALDDFVGVSVSAQYEMIDSVVDENPDLSNSKKDQLKRDQWWLLDAGDLQATAQILHRNVMGGLKPWVAGITSIRSETYTLVDMSCVLGFAPSPNQSWATLLSPRFDSNLALLWPHLTGMIPRHDLSLLEKKSTHPWVRRQWKDKEGRIWNELAVERVLLSKQFEQVWDPEQH